MRLIPYNRKINAPIRFLYYLEAFDLFIIMVLGFLIPLAISSFLPVSIPIWHIALWLAVLTFTLVIIKIGRAPGFIQHWLFQLFRPRSFHPGKKQIEPLIINEATYRAEIEMARNPDQPIGSEELRQIQNSVRHLRQARREAKLMAGSDVQV
jgi:hypothetical protein